MTIDWSYSSTDRRRKPRISALARLSRLPVGSSAKTIEGLLTRARAAATRCCWPPESSLGRWESRSRRPTVSMTVSNHSWSTFRPAMSRGRVMFSRADRVGTRLNAWNTKPRRSRRSFVRALSDRPAISMPSMTIRPLVGRSSAAMQCMSVDLPDPEGPMIAVMRPRANSTLTPSNARTCASPSPYTLVRSTACAPATPGSGCTSVTDVLPVRSCATTASLAARPRRPPPDYGPRNSALVQTRRHRGRGGHPADPFQGVVRQRRRRPPEGRAERAVVAPVAQPPGRGTPVAGARGTVDGRPQGPQLALGGHELGLLGGVPQHLAVAQEDQLEQGRDTAVQAPEHERVELHLEQRLGLEQRRRRAARLVVDDPHPPVGGDVQPVDVAAQLEAVVQRGLDVQLALGGLQAGGVLQVEPAGEELLGTGEPAGHRVLVAVEEAADLRLLGAHPLPLRSEHRPRRSERAFGGGQVEQPLQDGVHDGAAHGSRARGLRQPVDDPEPVQQRTLHEVRRPGGGESAGRHDCTLRAPTDSRRERRANGAVPDLPTVTSADDTALDAGPTGAAHRRGPLRAGDRVQLTDPKGRLHTITLTPGREFHTHRGLFRHEELIGRPEGSVVVNTAGIEYLALRPLLADYVLSMPRGAAVVYPKDAGQIVAMADIFPGARVVEAGVGSGALSMSLLRAVGDQGMLHSFERREDFADIAQGNVRSFFGGQHPAWTVTGRELVGSLPSAVEGGSIDRVVLDMLAPWECLDVVGDALTPGGVLICYVATATQLSRVAEATRDHGGFTEPQAWESLVRGWHLEGLAVRPEHRMHGHTGFLITTRRLAPGVTPPLRKRRPAKGAYDAAADATPGANPAPDGEWSPEDVGERPLSEKKIRRVRRSVTGLSLQEVPPAG